MPRREQGFTLVEVAAALAIGGLLVAGLATAVWQFATFPSSGSAEVVLHEEMRNATTWIRLDAANADSFEAATSPQYGNFRWLDYSTFPPTRHRVSYFWEDGVLYRQPTVEGVTQPRIPLTRKIADPADATFAVSETTHPSVPASLQRLLTVTMTATNDDDDPEQLQESTTLQAKLRPEQTDPLEHIYLFLHNNPTPPTADTDSQTDLPLDSTVPTATTLFNYDADRDASPGLRLERGPVGGDVDLSDTDKLQDWATTPLSQDMAISGRVVLYVNLAALAFAPDKVMTLVGWLRDFDPATATFTTIGAKGEVTFASAADWVAVSMRFDTVQQTVAQGHQLFVRLEYDGASEADGMVAYDTTTHLAFLDVPTEP